MPAPPKNHLRRAVRVLFCLLPVIVALASLAAGLAGWETLSVAALLAGRGCLFLAGLVAAYNFYLSFLRLLIHRLLGRPMESYRFVSGTPVIGDVLVVLGCLLSFGVVDTAEFGLGVAVFNTGGMLCFLVTTWRDTDVWDRP